MPEIPKLPLAVRLRQAAGKGGRAACPHLFRLFADTYFSNLDDIFPGASYLDTMQVVLKEHLDCYREMPTLPRLVADSEELSDLDQSQLLYQVLIRPYAELEEERERREAECLSLPF